METKPLKELWSDPTLARSDDLVELREVMHDAASYMRLETLGPPLVLNFIVDANVVLQHLGFVAGGRRDASARTASQEASDAGAVRLFAPFWLIAEVEKWIPGFAAYRKLDEATFRHAWSEYRARLHFFRADPVPDIDDVVDPKDLPYAYAQRTIGADAVITEDPHLLRSKAVPTLPTKLTHKTLRDWVRKRAVAESAKVRGVGTAAGGIIVGGAAVVGIGKAVAKRPWLAVIALLALGGIWWLCAKRKKETGESPIEFLVREIQGSAGRLADAYREADQEADVHMKRILDETGGSPSRTLAQWLLTTCIVAREPLVEHDIIARMRADGFRVSTKEGEGPSPSPGGDVRKEREAWLAREVGQLLRSDPRFLWTGTGWTTTLLEPETAHSLLPALKEEPSQAPQPVAVFEEATEIMPPEPRAMAARARSRRSQRSAPSRSKEKTLRRPAATSKKPKRSKR
jgi:hypothetical protein